MDDDRTRRERENPDDPVVLPAEETHIHEVRAVPPPPPGADADVNVVHEEQRTRVLPDGSVVQEGYRVEEQSRMRERLPWILIALLLALLVAGAAAYLLTRSDTKPVPAVVGLRIDEAVTRLQADGFKAEIARQSNEKAPGVVFGQNPAADDDADEGSSVRLLVSNGPSSKTVPNAVGDYRRATPAAGSSRPDSRSRPRRSSRISRPVPSWRRIPQPARRSRRGRRCA